MRCLFCTVFLRVVRKKRQEKQVAGRSAGGATQERLQEEQRGGQDAAARLDMKLRTPATAVLRTVRKTVSPVAGWNRHSSPR